MSRIATGVVSVPVPGLWQKFRLLSEDGSLSGWDVSVPIALLEEMGIPRSQFQVAFMLDSWREHNVPPDVALALWLLREREDGRGFIQRQERIAVEELGPAIRYIQLVAMLGEDCSSDPVLRRVLAWLLDRQLSDGGFPLIVPLSRSEVGQSGRVYQALRLLNDPALDDRIQRIVEFVRASACWLDDDTVAWPRFAHNLMSATGSTSHAIGVLTGAGVAHDLVAGGVRYLLAVQQRDGGWSEIAGNESTAQNTFLVVRALQAALEAGLAAEQDTLVALKRASGWLRQRASMRARVTYQRCFMVRIALRLGMLNERRCERLFNELAHRRRQVLRLDADTYVETELWAITLLECAREADRMDRPRHPQLTRLPSLPPPFLVSGAYAYEFFYRLAGGRRRVRIVDRVVDWRVVERVVGVLLGMFVALGVVDDYLVSRIDSATGDLRQTVTASVLLALAAGWVAAKTTVRSSLAGAVSSSVVSAAVSIFLVWILFTPGLRTPAVMMLGGLVWLIVDVVAFSADTSGLLDRVLIRQR